MTPFQLTKPIGIFYEHQQWFLLLFDKLNERGIPYVCIDARKELQRITDVNRSAAGYENFQQWLAGKQLEQSLALEDYSVSNRGLRSGLVGTPGRVAERVAEFEAVGVDLLLLQCSPQYEEMERFAEAIIQTGAVPT